MRRPLRSALLVCLLTFLVTPHASLGCACGCSIFEVGTSSMFPFGPGGTVFLEYDFLDQSRNWSGTSRAPAEDNPDKEIRTHFVTVGLQYMVDANWGFQVDVPYWNRTFRTTDDGGSVASYTHGALSDLRVQGLYSGFSPNLATGVSFGLKLPTGDYTYPSFDRDTEIGTGSTDLLLGVHHRGSLTETNAWSWFVQVQWEQPFLVKDEYRPGAEIGAGGGVHYNGWSPGGVPWSLRCCSYSPPSGFRTAAARRTPTTPATRGFSCLPESRSTTAGGWSTATSDSPSTTGSTATSSSRRSSSS